MGDGGRVSGDGAINRTRGGGDDVGDVGAEAVQLHAGVGRESA